MDIIGDRHYTAAAGEIITFSVLETTQVGGVTTPSGAALPLTVIGGGHQVVTVTVGFLGQSGGNAVIKVSGSAGGTDTSRIRQLGTLPHRSAFFVVD